MGPLNRPPPRPDRAPIRDKVAVPQLGEAPQLRQRSTPGIPAQRARPPALPPEPEPEEPEPPRRRLPSYSGHEEDSVVRHRLERLEKGHEKLETELPKLSGEMTGMKLEVANLASEVKLSRASSSSDTVKTIVAGVVTLVTAVIGSRLVAPDAKPEATVVHKSEAEIEAEVCGKLTSDQERSICLTGVLNRLVEPQKR